MAVAPSEWNFNSGSQQVWYGNDLWYENYLGKRSLEFDVNFTYNSQYRICSNSKLFTAVAIMQLVEGGLIRSIHDNVKDYLDESDLVAWGFPAGTKQWCPTLRNSTTCQNITFVSLMSMSSGIIASITCTYKPTEWQYQYCVPQIINAQYHGSIAATIQYFIHNPLQNPPGPAYGPNTTNLYFYANENFVILSYIIEKLSALSLRDYYQQHIFNVVGLSSTFYDPFSQAFLYKPQMATEYFYFTDLLVSRSPFAYGRCDESEVSPGFQAGSGGIVSTVPDMVKWYSSLFIAKNTSVVQPASLALITYPWSHEPSEPSAPAQFYGLGVDLLFDNPPTSPPAWPAPAPSSIFYMGGSLCTFFSIVAYFGRTNIFTGAPLVTGPLVAVAARNNRILNVTQALWAQTQGQRTGTFMTLTNFPTGWGAADGELTDTLYMALYSLFYFAALPFPGPVGPAPAAYTAGCGTASSGLSNGQIVAAVLIPCLVVMAGILAFFLLRWAPRSSVSAPMSEYLIDNNGYRKA